jgi:hypothetical protein
VQLSVVKRASEFGEVVEARFVVLLPNTFSRLAIKELEELIKALERN